MENHGRRAADALKAVDGVVDSYLRHSHLGGRRIANLAATIAIENSGASRGALFLTEGHDWKPMFSIQNDLTASEETLDAGELALLAKARSTAQPVASNKDLAAPIVLDGSVKGALFLRGFPEPPGEEVRELANGVASRIASLLRNAELLEALDRTEEDLTALADLAERLGSGEFGSKLLDLTLERALAGTRSRSGVVGIFRSDGRLERVRSSGLEEGSELAELPTQNLRVRDLPRIQAALPEVSLFEPLSSEVVSRRDSSSPSGFLAVSRPSSDDSYQLPERTFVRAVANLLSGALARRDYFEKASQDPLTAAGSRFALQLQMADAEARSLETERPFSVLLVDLDRFKEINDEYGHLTGDEVLKEVAQVLRARLRGLDTVARYGGDEFVVLLPDTGLDAALNLAEELRGLVRERSFASIGRRISLSIGVAESESGETAAETLRRADSALYNSKQEGRDRVTGHPSESQ